MNPVDVVVPPPARVGEASCTVRLESPCRSPWKRGGESAQEASAASLASSGPVVPSGHCPQRFRFSAGESEMPDRQLSTRDSVTRGTPILCAATLAVWLCSPSESSV